MQKSLRAYSSDFLLSNIRWEFLVSPEVPQAPFSIDTSFDEIMRPSFSLERVLSKRQTKQQSALPSSSARGARDFIVSTGTRELSLDHRSGPSSLLGSHSSSLVPLGMGMGGIRFTGDAARRHAIGTLKRVLLSTQQSASLTSLGQEARTQLTETCSTLGQRQEFGTSLGQRKELKNKQSDLELLMSELTESVSVPNSVHASLWEGWSVAGDVPEIPMELKRLQGVLLSRKNRVMEPENEDFDKLNPVLMWDVVSNSWVTD